MHCRNKHPPKNLTFPLDFFKNKGLDIYIERKIERKEKFSPLQNNNFHIRRCKILFEN